MKRFFLLFSILIIGILTGCKDDETPTPPTGEVYLNEIIKQLKTHPNLTNLTTLVENIDAKNINAEYVTIFALTDEVNNKLSASNQQLSSNIEHHIVNGLHNDLLKQEYLISLAADTLFIKKAGDNVLVNGIKIIESARVGNSLVYFLSNVLPKANSRNDTRLKNSIVVTVNPFSNESTINQDPLYKATIRAEGVGITVDWGDGTINTQSTHYYKKGGEYKATITGDIIDSLILAEKDEVYSLKSGILSCCSNVSHIDISNACNLKALVCTWNPNLSELDISSNLQLIHLHCNMTTIADIDLSKHTGLEHIGFAFHIDAKPDIKDRDIRLGSHPELKYLCYNYQNLAELSVAEFPKLEELSCNNSKLRTLDVSNNPNLRTVSAYNNLLTTINVEKNTKLEWLTCSKNKLTTLDVAANAKLKNLYFDDNSISTINLTNNKLLENLRCEKNKLTELDLSTNNQLKTIYCDNNKLSKLYLRNHTLLKNLHCNSNQLTELDLRSCSNLSMLYAFF